MIKSWPDPNSLLHRSTLVLFFTPSHNRTKRSANLLNFVIEFQRTWLRQCSTPKALWSYPPTRKLLWQHGGHILSEIGKRWQTSFIHCQSSIRRGGRRSWVWTMLCVFRVFIIDCSVVKCNSVWFSQIKICLPFHQHSRIPANIFSNVINLLLRSWQRIRGF